MLAGAEPERIVDSVRVALDEPPTWTAPAEYRDGNVSNKVVRIVLAYDWREQSPMSW
jgi:UDP-N-acetylglucosamine 2-epimerase